MAYIVAVYSAALLSIYLVLFIFYRPTTDTSKRVALLAVAVFLSATPLTFIGVVSGSAIVTAALIALTEELARGYLAVRLLNEGGLWRRSVFSSLPFALAETSNWIAGEKAEVALADLNLSKAAYMGLDYGYVIGEFLSGIVINAFFAMLWFLVLAGRRQRFWLAFVMPFLLHFLLDYTAISAT